MKRKLDDVEESQREYATGFWHQLRVVSARKQVAFWRSPDYGFTRLFNHCTVALMTSLTFVNIDNSKAAVQYRVFAVFLAIFLPGIILPSVQPMFLQGRQIYLREGSAKMYTAVVFALSELAAESLYSLLCAVVYFILFYFPIGFQLAADRAGYQFFMILILEFFSVTLGQAIASISPSVEIAFYINPFVQVTSALTCGVTLKKPAIPGFWRSWLYQVNPVTRLISGMVVTELHGLKITCKDDELVTFQPPSGQTCIQWANNFIQASGGYVTNGNATSDCHYCQYDLGDDFLRTVDISFDTRWRDLGIFIGFVLSNAIITLFASKYLRYTKR